MFVALMLEIFLVVMIVYMVFVLISLSSDNNDSMMSSYECGFEPMMGARMCFSYRFFLISILFLVFDVEITMLMPLPFMEEGWVQVLGVWCFMLVLMVGLLYEYYNGVLSWLSVKNI